MAYSSKVIDHYENPRNVGSLDKNDPNVGTGLVGAPACGDVMKLQIQVEERDGELIITDARFKTFGCGSAIASSSYVTELLKGKPMAEAEKITNQQIATELSLPPVKIHCSVLAEDAVKAAVQDLRKKRAELQAAQAQKAPTEAIAPAAMPPSHGTLTPLPSESPAPPPMAEKDC
ncbi:Fe-S cluster assembly scaffold IscU [Candidatus Uhrbacteria bacterium]|nr:Fe-S cluster assembly scaffold IscU [Candidatus Uhrbacteria bacterium]